MFTEDGTRLQRTEHVHRGRNKITEGGAVFSMDGAVLT
jgi:hypothetical protein